MSVATSFSVFVSIDPVVQTANAAFYDAPVLVNDVLCYGFENSLTNCSLDYGNFTDCNVIGLAICEGKIMFYWPW